MDLCLRAREAGYAVVFAPEAVLYHLESHTYGSHYDGERAAFREAEIGRLRARWSRVAEEDPFHSPNLCLLPGREWEASFSTTSVSLDARVSHVEDSLGSPTPSSNTVPEGTCSPRVAWRIGPENAVQMAENRIRRSPNPTRRGCTSASEAGECTSETRPGASLGRRGAAFRY